MAWVALHRREDGGVAPGVHAGGQGNEVGPVRQGLLANGVHLDPALGAESAAGADVFGEDADAAFGVAVQVIVGWGAAQYPYFILPQERIADVAAGDATLRSFLIALPIGALILIPSLILLYTTFSEKTGGADLGDASGRQV